MHPRECLSSLSRGERLIPVAVERMSLLFIARGETLFRCRGGGLSALNINIETWSEEVDSFSLHRRERLLFLYSGAKHVLCAEEGVSLFSPE